jgi:DNA-binding CsgD family transcriptional regulator
MAATGIKVELAVDSPDGCPVADASLATAGPAASVAWSGADDGGVVEEFSAPAGAAEAHPQLESVFDAPDATRYRFSRDEDAGCFCDAVEGFGCPIADVRAEEGSLVVTFHAVDVSQVRDLVSELREEYDGVSLRSLRQDGEESAASDAVIVERGKLTDRQREVLETAVEMGYYSYPKGANAGEVADALGISVSTLAEHLAAAQSKILDDILKH